MSGYNDIWSNGDGELPEEKLKAYLEGKLSAKEQREIEALLSEEGMNSDAVEGLKVFAPDEARRMVIGLNKQLQRGLAERKRGKRAKPHSSRWGWLAIALILLLCALGYLVIYLSVNRG